MLLSVISVIIMQSMAARLGIVAGMGLGEALREKFTGLGAAGLLAGYMPAKKAVSVKLVEALAAND